MSGSRLAATFGRLKGEHRKALSLFLTAGYPSPASTVPLVKALASAGADLIELGVPFSDPIADGPVIQQSSEHALRQGVTLESVFGMVQEIRSQTSVPLVLMGYANPIYAMGLEKFLATCKETGVDGTIVPDLSLEESLEYRTIAAAAGVDAIFLAAPTTPDDRLRALDSHSRGFLYAVSVAGVTGERSALAHQAGQFLARVRSCVTRNPLLVGFGISTERDAQEIARHCDGIIIGSAIIRLLAESGNGEAISRATDFARRIRAAIDDLPPQA